MLQWVDYIWKKTIGGKKGKKQGRNNGKMNKKRTSSSSSSALSGMFFNILRRRWSESSTRSPAPRIIRATRTPPRPSSSSPSKPLLPPSPSILRIGGIRDKENRRKSSVSFGKKQTINICRIGSCRRMFHSRRKLNVHIRKCIRSTYKYTCGDCNKGYASSSGWWEHRKSHLPTDEERRPAQCPNCGMRFVRNCNLTRHLANSCPAIVNPIIN